MGLAGTRLVYRRGRFSYIHRDGNRWEDVGTDVAAAKRIADRYNNPGDGFGTQAYTGDYHLSGFTAAILEQHLNLAGLQICGATILHSWLYDVIARKTTRLTNPDEFVHSSYFKVLGRPADDGGLRHFREAMAAGMTREKVLEVLDSSEEARFLREKPSYLLGA